MDEKLLKKGIKYVVKIGRNRVAVRLIQKNADGVSYLVKNLKTLKPFFVKSAKSFADFQNEDELQNFQRNQKFPMFQKYQTKPKLPKIPKLWVSVNAPSSRLSGAWATTARWLGKC